MESDEGELKGKLEGSSEFEIDGEQYVTLKKSDFVKYAQDVQLAHDMMTDCVNRIFKIFKAIPQQAVDRPADDG